jgi:uncharacterized protein (DUF58 family)
VTLAIGVLVAMLAVAWGRPVVLLWASAVAMLALGGGWWVRAAWSGVAVEVGFEPARAFIGETIAVLVRIENRKRLPLPIVRLTVRLPPGLSPDAAPDPTAPRGHRRRLSIPPRGEVVVRLPVFAAHRGEFWLDPINVELADPFDLAPSERSINVDRSLLVMPESLGSARARVHRWLPFGSPQVGARLFEDPEHFAGVRDYLPGDPMHHVHWRLSAHAGRLQTKRFEPTRTAEIVFALDLADGEPFWHAVDPEAAEETIGRASTLVRQALHAGWRSGIIANTHLRKGRGPLRVAPTGIAGQEAALFGALARMPNQPTTDLAPVLREAGRRLTRRTTVVVLSPSPGPSLLREMEVIRRKGSVVVLLAPPSVARPEAS